jgi:glycosyltransferase involved in cell wall biosynthesis
MPRGRTRRLKRILFVTNRYFPHLTGGAEITVQTLAQELRRRGHEVSVISLSPTADASQDEVNGIRVHRIVVRNVYAPFGAAQPGLKRMLWHLRDIHNADAAAVVGRILDAERPEIVSTHALGGMGVAVWREVRARGIRLVHTLHDYYLLCPRVTMFTKGSNCTGQCVSCQAFSFWKRHASRQVDVVIGISRFVLDAHVKRGFFPDAKQAVIYNSRALLRQTSQQREEAADTAPIRFGFIGRIEEEKGIEVLLGALSGVAAAWTLTVAGRAPELAYLEDLRRRFPLPQIEYVGYVEPADFYPSIDILVVPSLWNEPLGVVAFEALGYGVPVIASKRGGLPEILEGSGAGWLFDIGDHGALAAVLGEVLTTRHRIPRMRAAGYVRRQHFIPQRHADEFLDAVTSTSVIEN